MYDVWLGDRASARRRLGLGLVGVMVVGLGAWLFATRVVGEHIAACGFDAQGVYAKVRVNNLLGGGHDQSEAVDFSFRGRYYVTGYARADVPAHGYRTTVVRERFPPHGHLEGRTVYRWMRSKFRFGVSPRGWTFVTERFAARHPDNVSVQAVPQDPSILRCSIVREDDPD
jgi:hypothetical protein